jgi:hypothetical protein
MKSITRDLVTTVLALAVAAPAVAQQPAPQPAPQVRPGAQSSITLRGFVNATAFLQDNNFGFGNGQNAAWAGLAGPNLPNPATNPWILSADVRNTRLGLDFRGPPIGGGWAVNGTVEMDFFGGFAGAGATSDEQPVPRLRLAFADVTRGATTVRIGQFWSPLFGYVPASVSHLGFPLGYGSAGKIGWRFPGIFFYQSFTDAAAPTRAQLQLAAMRGSWAGPGPNLDHLSAGETSGFPQLQARLDLGGRTEGGVQWGAYAVAHYDQKDLRPYGTAPTGDDQRLDGQAFSAGLRVVPGPLTLHGSGYTGRAVGQHLAHITQFGDIEGWGAWAQAGFAFTPSWSAWLYYGQDNPDTDDVRAAFPAAPGRLRNQLITGMVRYASGPYQFGVEWLRAETDWWLPAVAAREQTAIGNQYSFSVVYSF